MPITVECRKHHRNGSHYEHDELNLPSLIHGGCPSAIATDCGVRCKETMGWLSHDPESTLECDVHLELR